MTGFTTTIAVTALAIIAATFTVGLIKTLREGVRGFDDFDRAGFTLSAFFLGRVPKADAGSSLQFGESAEISVLDGKISVNPTRTISKTLS